ncbi:FadR family transcriptional regulator [Pseudomaricurvus alcaniphilus]|uniref:FadR/GntR family transcriptional regulator n=1 Tax=Pseudomaricurvus alcaniphilus TaxID=1166482 RepID=UPI001408A272|nr:FCD domain-containing protein [Pseudomaricurvus alcaniphilus]NHN39974.1 FadR family transcriptional regulator [Pseudomaricurvus alcaniphilus]
MIDSDIEKLKDYIASARRQGVEKLPPEPRLSSEIGVSRGRLRTLLRKVESEGLIWRHVGKGTFVGHRVDHFPEGNMAYSISVDQVIQARLALEPQLAALAAMHAKNSDIQAMEASLEAMANATSFEHWKALDDSLHLTIASASHNFLLVSLYKSLKNEVDYHLKLRVESVFGTEKKAPQRLQTEEEHRAIVEAIELHDPDSAEALMCQHILSVRAKMFGNRL